MAEGENDDRSDASRTRTIELALSPTVASRALFVVLGVQVFYQDGRGHGGGLAQPYARPLPLSSTKITPDDFEGGTNRGDCPILRGKRAGLISSRLIEGSETFDASAKSFCSHRRSALAARICSLVTVMMTTFSILILNSDL